MTDQPEELFHPDRLPARDSDGWVFHPDLDRYDTAERDGDEGYYDLDAMRRDGWELNFDFLEHDVRKESRQAWEAYFDRGEPEIASWQPTFPEGEGWRLALISDHESDGPTAMFARKVG